MKKANEAVALDNAQKYESVIQAYSQACSLLQQNYRTAGEVHKHKFHEIVIVFIYI